MIATLNTNTASRVDIKAPARRTFEVEIDTESDHADYAYTLTLIDVQGNTALTFSASSGLTLLTEGRIKLQASATKMDVLPGLHQYELVRQNTSNVETIMQGTFIITPSIN